MNNTEGYQLGNSAGWQAANFAAAYENVTRYAPVPEVTDYRGQDRTSRERWDFERGYSDGWDRFMREDYPE
jgi:5-methylcytosine-specific restriction endonuclease McrA